MVTNKFIQIKKKEKQIKRNRKKKKDLFTILTLRGSPMVKIINTQINILYVLSPHPLSLVHFTYMVIQYQAQEAGMLYLVQS